jgi:hypothetical protein
MKNKVIGLLFFEEPTVTRDTFLVMMKNTAQHHVPVGKVFQSDGSPPHFSHHVHAFLDREFPYSLDACHATNGAHIEIY